MPNLTLATKAVTSNLATYLAAQVSGLTVLQEWPAANQKLVYPSLTIFSQPAKFTNHMPRQLSYGAIDGNNQMVATLDVGEYDLKLQLDLWCRSIPERDTFLASIIDAINAQVADTTGGTQPMGLSLQLSNYFNEWARYDIDGHQYADDGAAVERQERRAKIDVLANVRAIRQRTYYAMTTVDVYLDAALKDSDMTDDAVGTDIVEIT